MTRLSDLTKNWKISYEDGVPPRGKERDLYQQIMGKYGSIYLWDDKTVAVEVDNAKLAEKQREYKCAELCELFKMDKDSFQSPLQGVGRLSWFMFLFPTYMLDDVARIIKAKRRPQFSQAEREKRKACMIRVNESLGRLK